MNAQHTLQTALERLSDERGYIRTTIEELVGLTELSPSTVRRTLTLLVQGGYILRRSKSGPTGGLLIRLESPSKSLSNPCQIPVKSDRDRNDSNQRTGPEGALSPLVCTPPNLSPSSASRDFAYRPTAPHETPLSGAELLYTGPQPARKWRQLSATTWEAPNGDTVSIRSMAPELRLRLRVDENDDGTANVEAIRAIRGITP